MKIYKGQLLRLGNATSTSDMTTYKLIEVGDEVVKDLVVNKKLDSFLGDGLGTSQPIKLWTINMPFRKKGLVALQIGDSKKYISPPFSFFTMSLLILTFSLMAFVCFTMKSTSFSVFGGLILAEALWLFIMPMVRYFNAPRDGIRL